MTDFVLNRRHTALLFIVVFFAAFMDGLDSSIVSVALPTIGDRFGVDTATSSWVTIIYMMMFAGTLVAFARIADKIGIRKVMFYGLLVFTISSLMCGLAPNFGFLLGARVIQGIGAAMMGAAGPMCCTKHLPMSKLAFGLSIVSIGASMGFAMGPAVGGAIVKFSSWHWCFFINVPLGLLMAPLMLKAVSAPSGGRTKIDLDIRGTVLLCITIILGVFAVETLSYSEMKLVSVTAAMLCIVFLVLFVRNEKNIPNPLLNLRMFRQPGFSALFICLMFMNIGYMGVLYLVPFYAQIYLGKSPLWIGMYLFEASIVTAIFGLPMARWSDRIGRKPFCIAAGLIVTLTFSLYAILEKNMTNLELLIIVTLQGFGWALIGGPMASRMVEHTVEDRDMASSLTNEAYYIGGALGTALAAMTFTAFSGTDGVDIMDVPPMQFLDGFAPTMLVCATFILIVLILSIIVKDEKEPVNRKKNSSKLET